MINGWKKITYNKQVLNYLPDYSGIYMFMIDEPVLGLYNQRYIYIGKAQRQSIKSRVKQHFNANKKSLLYKYILKSIFPVNIMYTILDEDVIDQNERFLIKTLNPIINVQYKIKDKDENYGQ